MPLLSDESIAEKAQQRESFRLSNVSSRLTRRETERLDALAKQRGLQRGNSFGSSFWMSWLAQMQAWTAAQSSSKLSAFNSF